MRQIFPVYGIHYGPGYSVFTRRDGALLSEGISWFESLHEAAEFQASHMVLVRDERTGIEAAEKGIAEVDIRMVIKSPAQQVIFREPLGLTSAAASTAIEWAESKIGNPYDGAALFLGFPLMILTGLSKVIRPLRRMPVPFHIPGAWVCSAFVADAYKQTSYKNSRLLKEWHTSRITPAMMWNHFPYKPFKIGSEDPGGQGVK